MLCSAFIFVVFVGGSGAGCADCGDGGCNAAACASRALIRNFCFDSFVCSSTSWVVSWYSLFIRSYVCAIRLSKSLLFRPIVDIGGNVLTIIFPLSNRLFLSSKNVRYELNTTGRIGIWASMATWNAPFLNGCRWPVLRRVPSGKIHNFIFLFLMFVVALHSWSRARSDCIRLMKMRPQSQAANPKGHAKNSSRFATTVHLFITGHISNIPVNVNRGGEEKKTIFNWGNWCADVNRLAIDWCHYNCTQNVQRTLMICHDNACLIFFQVLFAT